MQELSIRISSVEVIDGVTRRLEYMAGKRMDSEGDYYRMAATVDDIALLGRFFERGVSEVVIGLHRHYVRHSRQGLAAGSPPSVQLVLGFREVDPSQAAMLPQLPPVSVVETEVAAMLEKFMIGEWLRNLDDAGYDKWYGGFDESLERLGSRLSSVADAADAMAMAEKPRPGVRARPRGFSPI